MSASLLCCCNSRQLCVFVRGRGRGRGRGCSGWWQEALTSRRNKGPCRTWLKIGNEQRSSRVRRFCYTRLLPENCAASHRRLGTAYRSRLQFDSWPLKMDRKVVPKRRQDAAWQPRRAQFSSASWRPSQMTPGYCLCAVKHSTKFV